MNECSLTGSRINDFNVRDRFDAMVGIHIGCNIERGFAFIKRCLVTGMNLCQLIRFFVNYKVIINLTGICLQNITSTSLPIISAVFLTVMFVIQVHGSGLRSGNIGDISKSSCDTGND